MLVEIHNIKMLKLETVQRPSSLYFATASGMMANSIYKNDFFPHFFSSAIGHRRHRLGGTFTHPQLRYNERPLRVLL